MLLPVLVVRTMEHGIGHNMSTSLHAALSAETVLSSHLGAKLSLTHCAVKRAFHSTAMGWIIGSKLKKEFTFKAEIDGATALE